MEHNAISVAVIIGLLSESEVVEVLILESC